MRPIWIRNFTRPKSYRKDQSEVRKSLLKSTAGANFIELLKQKNCLSTKIARLFYTCYWPKSHTICIACDLYLAVVYLA